MIVHCSVPISHTNEHFPLFGTMKVKSISLSIVSDSLRPYGLQSARLLHPCDSPGKNSGVGRHSLLQGIFPAQGLKLGLLITGKFFTVWATREALETMNIAYIHRSNQEISLRLYKVFLQKSQKSRKDIDCYLLVIPSIWKIPDVANLPPQLNSSSSVRYLWSEVKFII